MARTLAEILKIAAPAFSAEAAPLAARLFSTKLGPTGAQALKNRANAVTERITAQNLAKAHALGDAAGPTSSRWLASRSGWGAQHLQSPGFDNAFEQALKAAAARDEERSDKEIYAKIRQFAPMSDDVVRRLSTQFRRRGHREALRKLSFFEPEKVAMELAFDSGGEARRHQDLRGLAQGAGGALGGLAGLKAVGRAGTLPQKLLGGFVGAGLGAVGTGVAMDSAHDIPQRTRAQYDTTQQRLHAAGGVPALKLADLADDFIAALEQDEGCAPLKGNETLAEADLKARTSTPGWGAAANVDGSGTQGGNMHIGAGMSYGGV